MSEQLDVLTAQATGESVAMVGRILDAAAEVIADRVRVGVAVRFRGVGVFQVKAQGARRQRTYNFKTRQAQIVRIPARRIVDFRPAAQLREL